MTRDVSGAREMRKKVLGWKGVMERTTPVSGDCLDVDGWGCQLL